MTTSRNDTASSPQHAPDSAETPPADPRPLSAPWGTFPGRAAVLIALNEALVHGWDLAVATGQPAEADPGLAHAALGIMQVALPASPRGGPIPFGPVVEPAPDAGPTERLANWSGRRSAPWR